MAFYDGLGVACSWQRHAALSMQPFMHRATGAMHQPFASRSLPTETLPVGVPGRHNGAADGSDADDLADRTHATGEGPDGEGADGQGVDAASESPNPQRLIFAAVAATLVMAIAGSLLWSRIAVDPDRDSDEDEAAAVEPADPETLETPARPEPPASVSAYQAIAPSLVWITTSDAPDPDGDPSGGLGTGFIANASGDIVTALHVVADADSIDVIFADGTRGTATIERVFPDRDIAVLSADASPSVLVPAVLGGGVRVGDEVFAVGNPLGLASSLSAGVVSGLNRQIPIGEGAGDADADSDDAGGNPVEADPEDGDTADPNTLSGLIQFDAAVNPGNSGGPLLDSSGRVVGVVTALANPADQNFFVGIGFAATLPGGGGDDGDGIVVPL